MSNLVYNPLSKDYFKAKACIAIPRRYNYADSCRTYRFKYLSFITWSSSYRAAFCYVLKNLENTSKGCESGMLPFSEISSLFIKDRYPVSFYTLLDELLKPYFSYYLYTYSPVQKLSFVSILLECLVMYNLGVVRFYMVSPKFEEKSAIRYAVSKFFSDTSFKEIESDFMLKDVMD